MSQQTRRRFLHIAGGAIAVGLAGCSASPGDENGNTTTVRETTETSTATETPSPSPSTSKSASAPGNEDGAHWHGKLYIEIDGERMNLSQQKFEDAKSNFHFHDERDTNTWHNVNEVLTLEAALDEIPHVDYAAKGGAHVLTIEGVTYDGADANTVIRFQQRDVEIDPTTYKIQDGDILWILVSTNGETPTPSLGENETATTTATNTTTNSTGSTTTTS